MNTVTAAIKYLDPRQLRLVIFIIITLIWCGVIFSLSAQNAEESSETSAGVIDTVCEMVVPEFSDQTPEEREEIISGLQFTVRKLAHFTAYLLLGASVLQVFLAAKKPEKRLFKAAAALGYSALYSVSDEFHQTFVPGRSGELRDVLIDSGGALCGILISFGVIALIHKIKSKKHSKDIG